MKSLSAQYDKMKRDVALCERNHRMTKAKRREFELLTARALRRSMQLEKRKH